MSGTWLMGFALACMLYTAAPVYGQRGPARPSARPDTSEVLRGLRSAEAASVERARRWAAERDLPRRIRQPDGRHIELVGVEDGYPLYLTSLNQEAAFYTGTDRLYPGAGLGLSLTGQGMRIGIWDEGHPLATHQELQGRVVIEDDGSPQNHSTHVAGTLIAAGIRPEARGMAYEANLTAYEWNNDTAEMGDEAAGGLLVSNHSYSLIAGWHYGNIEGTGDGWYWMGESSVSSAEDYQFGWYSGEAARFDQVAYAYPYYLPVVAAGNDRQDAGPMTGTYRARNAANRWETYSVATRPHPRDGGSNGFDTTAGAAVAKNVLTVGAIGAAWDGTLRVSSFSSFGPVDDGRIKPDLVGYGEDVFSTTAETRTKYAFFSGTSMATPNVAGSLLLLQQHARNLNGHALRAASLKGLALHTARDLGLPGPDYASGWGLLDAEAAAAQIDAALTNPIALLETGLSDGKTIQQSATVETPGPVRVTITWTDPPSAPLPLNGSTSLDDPRPHLKNDLDVRLIHDATGTEYAPFVLDPSHPSEPAAPGDNRVDPVEQIYVPQAPAGTYTIVVSHKGRLTGGDVQPVTLLVSGARDVVRPVVVGQLTAEADVGSVALAWETRSEQSTGTFIIERAALTEDASGTLHIGPTTPLDTLATAGSPNAYSFRDTGVISGYYRYRVRYEEPAKSYIAAETDVLVPVPEDYAVLTAYPNPFAGRTNLVLDLPSARHVRLEVYDALGRRVAVLRDEHLPAGRHTIPVDAARWAPGVYFARIATSDGLRTYKLVVIR